MINNEIISQTQIINLTGDLVKKVETSEYDSKINQDVKSTATPIFKNILVKGYRVVDDIGDMANKWAKLVSYSTTSTWNSVDFELHISGGRCNQSEAYSFATISCRIFRAVYSDPLSPYIDIKAISMNRLGISKIVAVTTQNDENTTVVELYVQLPNEINPFYFSIGNCFSKGDNTLTPYEDTTLLTTLPTGTQTLATGLEAYLYPSKIYGKASESGKDFLQLYGFTGQTANFIEGFTDSTDSVATRAFAVDYRGYLGLNCQPSVMLHAVHKTDNASGWFEGYKNSTNAPTISFRKARGTYESPATANAWDFAGALACYAYNGSSFSLCSNITTQVISTPTAGATSVASKIIVNVATGDSTNVNLAEFNGYDKILNIFGKQKITNNVNIASVPLEIVGMASQTGNLQNWKNSDNTILSKIDKDGNLTATNFTGSSAGSNTGDETDVTIKTKLGTEYSTVVTNSHTHPDLVAVNKVIDSGDGTQFLSSDGTYRTLPVPLTSQQISVITMTTLNTI